jgi:flagellar P-ring protein precursor FlgI
MHKFLRPLPSWTAKLVLTALLASAVAPTWAERLKDLASVRGVRDNQLLGYGLMVGLDGSGDQTAQTPFTAQSTLNMLTRLGIALPPGTPMHLKNVAAVMVTATLPAFARPGQALDVTVSSLGNARSLRGGTLLMTPLKGADNQVYAVAQGSMVVGGAMADANGSQVKINQLSSGRIPAGALVERAIASPLGEGDTLMLELSQTDFGTAQRAADAINLNFGPGVAEAVDGRVIRVAAPEKAQRVGFLARLQDIEISPSQAPARVVINARTGSVVMNQAVRIQDCAVAHGSLSVVITTQPVISQPNPLSGGTTVATQRSQIELSQANGALQLVPAGASLTEVIKSLNSLGANPQDLISILQAMKAVGALRAELEVI